MMNVEMYRRRSRLPKSGLLRSALRVNQVYGKSSDTYTHLTPGNR